MKKLELSGMKMLTKHEMKLVAGGDCSGTIACYYFDDYFAGMMAGATDCSYYNCSELCDVVYPGSYCGACTCPPPP